LHKLGKIPASTFTNTTSAVKQEKKIKIKDNKILSQFCKTISIIDNLVPGNGTKNIIETNTASAQVAIV